MPLTWTDNRVLSGQELTRLAAAIAGTYVVPVASGGAVTASSLMTVAVAAITKYTGLYVNGVQDSTGYAGGTTIIATADPTNPRRDYVWTDGAGAIGNTTGTPAANPVLPDLTTGRIALAEIYVTPSLTTIAAGNIIDRRANLGAVTPFDGIQIAFRSGRKVLGEYSASTLPRTDSTSSLWNTNFSNGFAFASTSTSALQTVTQIGGEQYDAWVTGTATTVAFGSVNAGNDAGNFKLPTAPAKSPRMLIRWIPGASSASLTTTMAGFFAVTVDNAASATSSGAYLRANTTGNLFFVTRQGGTETTTDLGVRPTVLTSYEIETVDAGVTWTCRNSTTGTVVATSTTNVPTAATPVGYGCVAVSGSGSLSAFGVGYIGVWASFTP